jgi:transcriptional regulator with XRE-family HTH domain
MRPIDADQLIRDLGRRLAEVRMGRALTQEQLADRMGISVKYLQRLERGRNMSLRTLVDFANGLNVALADLLLEPPKTREVRVGRPAIERRPASHDGPTRRRSEPTKRRTR